MKKYYPCLDVVKDSDYIHYPINGKPNEGYSKAILENDIPGVILCNISLPTAASSETHQIQACWSSDQTKQINWAIPFFQDLKNKNKKIIISFCGFSLSSTSSLTSLTSNIDISQIYTVEELEMVYSTLIEIYNTNHLDFSLVTKDEYPLFNLNKICLSLKSIIKKHHSIEISISTEINESGLNDKCLEILKKLKEHNINFIINILILNFNSNSLAIDQCKKIINDLKDKLKSNIYLNLQENEIYSKIAVTVSILDRSKFTLKDAEQLSLFSKNNNLSFTSILYLNNDLPNLEYSKAFLKN